MRRARGVGGHGRLPKCMEIGFAFN